MRFYLVIAIGTLVTSCAAPQKSYPDANSPVEALFQAVERAAEDSKAGAILEVEGCGLSFRKASGVANRKTGAPMPMDEQLRIASIGKLYTAAVIHKLAEDGLLDLDAPVTRYLAEGQIDGVPNSDATVRQLLNHTSGVPDYYDTRSYLLTDWTQPITPERTFEIARRKSATNAPGASYSYSNTNYQILGLVAERITGESLGSLISKHLLGPLGLVATRYHTEHPGGTIHGYGTELNPNADTWKYAENTGADSGITATSSDLSKFLGALFVDGGEFSAIGEAMLADPVERDRPRQFAGTGAEILVSRAGTEFVGHTGDTFGYLTFAFAVPEYGATMVGQVTANKKDIFVELLSSTATALEDACKSQ